MQLDDQWDQPLSDSDLELGNELKLDAKTKTSIQKNAESKLKRYMRNEKLLQ